MARQRVQVAPLEAPTSVTPVASTVDVYVKPAKQEASSGLAEFISAITPALKVKAQQEIKIQQEQNEAIQDGIATQQSFQAKLARTELISEVTNGYEKNKEYYLEAGRDVVATDRKQYITDYITDLEKSGTHPAIIKEIKNDFDLATAKFFLDPKDGYNVQKAAYDLNKRDEQVFQQIFKIDDNPNITREQKTAEIADIAENYIKLRGNPKEFFDKFIPLEVTRSGSRGQTSVYDYLNSDLSKNRLNVTDYIDDAEAIKKNQAGLDKARLKVNKPLIKEAAVDELVTTAVAAGSPASAKVGQKITVPDGAGGSIEFTVTKEMAARSADKQFFAADQLLKDEIESLKISNDYYESDPSTFATEMEALQQKRVDLEAQFFNTIYNGYDIVPARYKLPISAGLPFLQGGDVSEGSQGLAALDKSLKAIRDFKSMGGSMSSLGLSKDQEFKVNALNALLTSGRELRDIAPLAAKPIPSDFGNIENLVTDERVRDTIDTGFWDGTNIDEAQIGYPSLLLDIQKQAKAIMFMSEVPMSAEEAVALAIPQVRENYLTLRTSQWDAFALGDPRHFSVVKKVKGQLNTQANEEILNDILFRTFENDRIKEIIAPRLEAIGSSTTGFFDPDMAFAWQQDSRNANMLNLMAYAEGDYSRMVRVGTVNLQTLTDTNSVVFANELADELNKSVEEARIEAEALNSFAFDSEFGMPPSVQRTETEGFTLPSFITPAGASELLPEDKPTELTRAIDTVVSTKNIPSGDVEQIMLAIAQHETGGTMDPKTIQRSDKTADGKGPARGILQYEPERFFTSINRAKQWHKKQGKTLPSWVSALDRKVKGKTTKQLQDIILELSGQQQIALGIYDLLEAPNADFSKVDANNPESIAEFWVENWWIGPKGTTQKTKDEMKKKFVASLKPITTRTTETKTIRNSGVPEDLDSFAFGQTFP